MECKYFSDCNGRRALAETGVCYDGRKAEVECPYFEENMLDGLQWKTVIKRIAREVAKESGRNNHTAHTGNHIGILTEHPSR